VKRCENGKEDKPVLIHESTISSTLKVRKKPENQVEGFKIHPRLPASGCRLPAAGGFVK
jgi:hypothetical protein